MKHQHREMIRALIKGKCDVEKSGDDEGVLSGNEENDVVPEKQKNEAKVRAKSL
ncbi:MAG: hypothetical protein HYR78_05685, partial [Nitrospirae bacterium]|nr:hypothetical protein [Nitrospirota bacterium]